MEKEPKKLSLGGLSAIVLGTMIGAGIYDIARTMAAGASPGGVLLSWLVAGIGMMFLVLTFKILADGRPDLDAGIYQYAQQVAGNYVGFNIAWGYWLSVTVSLVALAVMLNDSMGAFFPVFLTHGWPTLLFGLLLIWIMCAVVMRGVNVTAHLNTAMTVLKFVMLIFVVVVLIIYARIGAMSVDLWGRAAHLGSLGRQIHSDMMVALWCFIGVEGAVMMSSRARRPADVGKAGMIGFVLALILYVLVSVLCFGIMSQSELAALPDPSIAYVLKAVCGDWAYYFVIISVIVSLTGCWTAWTLVCAQTPYGAASVKIMPAQFLRMSPKNVPHFALIASCLFMTLFMVLVYFSHSLFMAAVDLTGVMVLPAYFFSALFLIRFALTERSRARLSRSRTMYMLFIGSAGTVFTVYMMWAAGWRLLLMSGVFYLIGTYFYIQARRQHFPEAGRTFKAIMSPGDRCIFALLCAASLATIILIALGYSPF
ncbi:MAG: amino acid permease [Muribaculaceae bacterium]|nr:amino acid permease [Muribaculaceae bacterium]